MLSTNRVKKTKPPIIILLFLPSFYWIYLLLIGNLGVNPIEKLMDNLGEMALRLIILTLIISSLSDLKFFRSLVTLRRTIGLFAFYYVCLHFSTYIFLDHFFNFQFIIKDIIKRPFITFGFISFLCLIPMAITSFDGMIKKLGAMLYHLEEFNINKIKNLLPTYQSSFHWAEWLVKMNIMPQFNFYVQMHHPI